LKKRHGFHGFYKFNLCDPWRFLFYLRTAGHFRSWQGIVEYAFQPSATSKKGFC